MESAGVRYFLKSCWRIRNRTSERSERVTFLIQKQRVGKYRIKHFPCGILFIMYTMRHSSFWQPFFSNLSKILKLLPHTAKWQRSRSVSLLVKTPVKNMVRVRIWGNPKTTKNPNCLFWMHILYWERTNLSKMAGLNISLLSFNRRQSSSDKKHNIRLRLVLFFSFRCCFCQFSTVFLRWLHPGILWGYHPNLKLSGIPTLLWSWV